MKNKKNSKQFLFLKISTYVNSVAPDRAEQISSHKIFLVFPQCHKKCLSVIVSRPGAFERSRRAIFGYFSID